ncbi:zinc carboxypeptidase [Flavihumibacter sp. R14]|nr:zinc carboxypeptidase [Flavihumibacter soli]
MRRTLLFFFLLLISFVNADAQKIKSPSEFLGYKLGDQFTPHYRVVEYFSYLASVSKDVMQLKSYGKTYENRPLLAAFVSSPQNIAKLEDIRKNNLRLAGVESGAGETSQPAIVWLSYNVHGNESVSTEASMQTLYDLVDPSNSKTKSWLQNLVVVIDPCLNPDGRERYVNFYNPVRNLTADPLPSSREHMEPWPGGRANHYYFDLNRDWAWQTQVETQQRVGLYNQWLPQVHVDFHEQGINEPYYFAPAAEPYHQDITKWQREFQTIIGKNNARYFDEKGWMYFTRERFDLLYPSYGDTYPTYNGSVGMTYEQGGSGRAGLAVINEEGDTLTLRDRIEHHYTTGLSTVEAASRNAEKAVNEFKSYFASSKSNPAGEYKAYVVKGKENPEKLKALATLLKGNGIDFGYGSSKGANGFNYFTGKTESFSVEPTDLVISAYQPKSVMLKVLFEPTTFVSDSATYDITAWAMPYAFGLQAYATKEALKPQSRTLPVLPPVENKVDGKAVAYIANWNAVADVKFLAELLKKNVKVRYSEVPFESGGKRFNAGSLIIARTSNESLNGNFDQAIAEIASKSGITLQSVSTAFVDKGADLGSDKIRYIKKPTVGLIAGEGTSSLSAGQIWHFFEQQIGYPLTILRPQDVGRLSLNEFDVLIFPDGEFEDFGNEKMQAWIRQGGKLIAMEGAVAQLAGKKGFSLKTKADEKKDEKSKDPYENLKSFKNRERDNLPSSIPGAIYKVNMDNSHPLAFGYPEFYYTLKLDDRLFSYLDGGWNVGVLKKNNYITGFAGQKTKKKLVDGLLFGVEEMGRGSVVYLTDDPLFRSFWENGKLMFSNAVFMVGR